MMNVGIFNIYWFGDTHGDKFHHAPEDDARLASLIGSMNTDVFGFIEIVDVPRFEALLGKVGPTWTFRDAANATLTSVPGSQHLVLAWKTDTVELVRWRRIDFGNRSPIVARLKERATGKEVLAILVHPKSSVFTDPDGIAQRTQTFEAVVSFLADPPPGFSDLPAFVFGDLNSLAGSPEQAPLVAQDGWRVLAPTVVPAGAGVWTTNLDKAVIDHFVISPAIAVTGGPTIIAYDHDPAIDDPGGSTDDVMKRLSDHRPVWVTLELPS
jgi:endonuclease/exonuclease/phosphatase family metal-dependent hydrolase